MLVQKIQKILNIDIRKTSALKTRMRMRMWMRISDPSLVYTSLLKIKKKIAI